MGSALPLTPPRAREADRLQPLIIRPVRADLPDYGPPGPHLTGPWAKTKSFQSRLVAGALAIDGEGPGLGLDPCGVLDGDSVVFTPSLTAGQTLVQVSRVIARPFRIEHLQYWSDATVPNGTLEVQLAVRVSSDQDTTGGLATSGELVGNIRGTTSAEPFNVTQTTYPSHVIYLPNQFIKAAWVNNSAAARETYLVVSFKYLQ